MSDGVLDQPVMIGARKTLVGIVTQPVDYEPTDQPVFLILNSGIIHRVGHHRMYVTLAQLLAGLGRQVLRFDLSGIGDSDSRDDARSIFESALTDVREAVDWLFAARGARRVILVGLCSGADQALVYGISDPRVCGLVLLDPSIPPTGQHMLRYFLKRFVAPEAWLNFGTGRGLFWKTVRKRLGLTYDDGRERYAVNLNDPAVRGFLQDAYQRVVDLEIKCLAVFSSGLQHQHSYRRQILDAFPAIDFKGNLRLEYFAGCDHVFSSRSDRNRLFRTMLDWIQDTRFGGPAGGDPAARQDTDPKAPNELIPLLRS
jgi:pimeloyl-ACP methyl ester carboxylesterase